MTDEQVDAFAYQIPGWLWPSEIAAIRWILFNRSYSKHHVEVGTYCGKSAYITANAMNRFGALPGGLPRTINCVDNFSMIPNAEWHKSVLIATVAAIHREVQNVDVSLVKDTSVEAARRFCNEELCSVYLDADHNYAECKADIEIWSTKIRPGGVIFGHDYDARYPGVMDAVNETGAFNLIPQTRIWWREIK